MCVCVRFNEALCSVLRSGPVVTSTLLWYHCSLAVTSERAKCNLRTLPGNQEPRSSAATAAKKSSAAIMCSLAAARGKSKWLWSEQTLSQSQNKTSDMGGSLPRRAISSLRTELGSVSGEWRTVFKLSLVSGLLSFHTKHFIKSSLLRV